MEYFKVKTRPKPLRVGHVELCISIECAIQLSVTKTDGHWERLEKPVWTKQTQNGTKQRMVKKTALKGGFLLLDLIKEWVYNRFNTEWLARRGTRFFVSEFFRTISIIRTIYKQ